MIQLLGPDGVNQRIQEIQDKLKAITGGSQEQAAGAPTSYVQAGAPPKGSFAGTLQGLMPADPGQFNISGGGAALPGLSGSTPLTGVIAGTDKSKLTAMAVEAANKHGVDPAVFQKLVNAESSWDPSCTSNKGAMGLTQLMPSTASELGVSNPLDPQQSLDGGAKYLRQMLDRFGNNYTKAVAAYNAGPGAVERAGGVPPYQETVAYVNKILGGGA